MEHGRLVSAMLFFLLDRRYIEAEELNYILTMDEQLAHLLLRGLVVGIRRLFIREQLGVFGLQGTG